jgi:V/A-type H+-transporting ATPase subunit E
MSADTSNTAVLETAALVALIHEQSAAEAAEVLAQGHERAQRIATAAAAEAEALRAAARREGEERGRRRAAKLLAAAEAESRRQWLWEREALLQDAIDRARERLARFPALPDAGRKLTDLIRAALQALPNGAVRVRLPEAYAPLLDAGVRTAVAGQREALQFESGVVPEGGIIVETDDGRLRFDNSFEARIRRRMHRLRRIVADVLLAEEGTGH